MSDTPSRKSATTQSLGDCSKLLALHLGVFVGVGLAGLAAWQFVVAIFDIPPAVLPTPLQVAGAGWDEREALWEGMITTAAAAVIGLAVAIVIGCTIAIAFSQSRSIRMAFFPYVIFLQTVPIVAIAPLLIIWSGYQFRTVVIVTVIICLFPIVNNVTHGLMTVNRELADLFRLYGASRSQQLLRLQIPTAVRSLIVGAKTSSGLAVIGAILADFFVGSGSGYSGLGTRMTLWQGNLRTDALIAAIAASTLLGMLLFGGVQLVGTTILRRWTR